CAEDRPEAVRCARAPPELSSARTRCFELGRRRNSRRHGRTRRRCLRCRRGRRPGRNAPSADCSAAKSALDVCCSCLDLALNDARERKKGRARRGPFRLASSMLRRPGEPGDVNLADVVTHGCARWKRKCMRTWSLNKPVNNTSVLEFLNRAVRLIVFAVWVLLIVQGQCAPVQLDGPTDGRTEPAYFEAKYA